MKLRNIAIIGIIFINLNFSESLNRSLKYTIVGGKYDGYTIQARSGSDSSYWNYYRPDGTYWDYWSTPSYGQNCGDLIKVGVGQYECSKETIYYFNVTPDKLPPILSIENIRFTKDQISQFAEIPADVLLGGESGYIEFDLINNGKGSAKAVLVSLTGEHEEEGRIPIIEGGATYGIKFPIKAALSANNAQYNYRITAIDYNEFEADSKRFSVEVREASTPQFEIGEINIDDDQNGDSWGNNNQVINKGEAIELTFILKNTGNGIADNVSIIINQIDTPKGFFLSSDQMLAFNFEEFEARSEKSFTFSFLTNKKTNINRIPIKVEITEKSGEFGKTFNLDLPIIRGPE